MAAPPPAKLDAVRRADVVDTPPRQPRAVFA
jgi:hypothetical protein